MPLLLLSSLLHYLRFFFHFRVFYCSFSRGMRKFLAFLYASYLFSYIRHYLFLSHTSLQGRGKYSFFSFFECSFLAFLAFHLNKLRIILFLRYFAHFQYIAQFSLEWMFITVIFLVYPWFLYPKWLFINRKWVLFGWHNSIYGISLIFRLNSINSFISHLFLFALSIGDGNKIYWINSIFRQFPHAIGIHIFVLHSREFA